MKNNKANLAKNNELTAAKKRTKVGVNCTIAFALVFLTGCQTTSLRDANTDPVFQAEFEHNQNASAKPPSVALKEDQLRMYVFTDYETKKLTDDSREGYFIDFAPDNETPTQ